ncbi:condensation domain-containing protein [Kitasatospora sp. NBC_01266]|uniref:condensation domain-containing protein n=1 Tax=Kitasatospora sp. NBC_01266 TaxID=2903572 RepID=UPI002E32EA0C|nr:condensation domain-containing protein [Kitasatospora sp. NBC_01266]
MSSHHSSADTVLAVLLELDGEAPRSALALELCGPLGLVQAEAVADRLAERHRGYAIALDGGRGRYVLRLEPADTAPGPVPLTADLLADLLAPLAGVDALVPVTGHQRELLLAAVGGQGGPGRHVEQLSWNWSGPLDLDRFSTAWQSVAEREVVLRASFDWTGAPRLVLHDRATIDIARRPDTAIGWGDILKDDRARGFQLHRPGLLRVTLLEAPRGARSGGRMSASRILVTYHRAVLDERGVLLLVREFYRAYVSGGGLPGGDRRPDIRDHARWLAGQHTDTARRFWALAVPPRGAAVSVGRPGDPTGYTGPGRLQRRLRPPQTSRLRSWAAVRGVGESSALHVVWALLLYRAAGADGPLPVTFGVHLSSRELSLPGAAGIPGVLGNPLPVTVTVDPAAPLVELLWQVRDAALDLSAYAWVSGDLIREWSGLPDDAELGDTLVQFDSYPELPQTLRAELEVQGIEVDTPHSAGSDTSLPITLVAQHDAEGGMLLSATYDRARLADGDASGTLSQCMQLLRGLPDQQDQQATVAQVLDLLDAEVPRVARRGCGPKRAAPTVLRPGEPQAGVICLVEVPGVPAGAYELLTAEYQGPERIVSFGPDDAAGGWPAELGDLLLPGRRLVVCGCGPGSAAAYELARRATARSGTSATVVMTGIGDAVECARALARALECVRARSGPEPGAQSSRP